MTSVRIHSVQSSTNGHTPFLILKLNQAGKVLLLIPELQQFQIQDLEIEMPSDDIYRILEGRAVRVLSGGAILEMTVERDQLSIHVTPRGQSSYVEFRVWLTELAVAWNLLCGC